MTIHEGSRTDIPISWRDRYSVRTHRMRSSEIREILKVTEQPDFISLAGGMPAPEVFPVDEVRTASDRILTERGPAALQYGATEGYRPLRELVAEAMRAKDVPCSVDNILITTGSQQALDLLGKVFIDEGDTIVTESPTYLAAIQTWSSYGARFRDVKFDGDGMVMEGLKEALAGTPKTLYSLPNFQNPSGVTLTTERRERLVDLTASAGVPVVEDDPYRELRFEGSHLPRLIELAAARSSGASYDGHVIYLSTFSKTLAPGLRVGWIVAPAPLIAELTIAKQGVDLHTATFNQMIAYELARSGFLERHAHVIVSAYRERRDSMLMAMDEYFPGGVTWTHPKGGMFLWVTLPEGLDAADVLRDAIEQKVAFVPGAPFHPSGIGANTLRLNFSNATPERIREGIGRLGTALHRRMGKGLG